MTGYSIEEQALIALVQRTYGVTEPVDMATELGDMQGSDGRWFYRADHAHMQRVFEAHYQMALGPDWIGRKTQVWELWHEIDRASA